MDDGRVGAVLRALRRKRGWRHCDLAARAGCSQATVSLIERGHVEGLTLRLVRQMGRALDARLELAVLWRGGDVDRIADARHAALVETAASRYLQLGWDVHVEVTYSHFGERGAIDLLAIRPDHRAVVVNEIKSELTAIEELNRRHDQKTRLASDICLQRFGWRPLVVGRVLARGSNDPPDHRRSSGDVPGGLSAWQRRAASAAGGALGGGIRHLVAA